MKPCLWDKLGTYTERDAARPAPRPDPCCPLLCLLPHRSMEGATLSGRQCAYKILEDADKLAAAAAAKQQQQAVAA